VRVVIAENELKGMSGPTPVVSVPLNEYESTDYRKNKPIMQKGYDAANAKASCSRDLRWAKPPGASTWPSGTRARKR